MLKAIALATVLLAACYGSGTYSGTATVEATPALVEVSPGVQVVEDYDYPVFYSDGAYWRYDAGIWYRSPQWRGGWARTYDVPARVRGIDRPGAYAHYRSSVTVNGPVRDHRDYRPAPAPAPVVRDHRDDAPPVIHHDDHRDERENRVPMPQPTPAPAPHDRMPREEHPQPREEHPQPAHEQPKHDNRDKDRDKDRDKHHHD